MFKGSSDENSVSKLVLELNNFRAALTRLRRDYTKIIVTHTNEENSAGGPYVVKLAEIVSSANLVEFFMVELVDTLVVDVDRFGPNVAVENCLRNAVFELYEQNDVNPFFLEKMKEIQTIIFSHISILSKQIGLNMSEPVTLDFYTKDSDEIFAEVVVSQEEFEKLKESAETLGQPFEEFVVNMLADFIYEKDTVWATPEVPVEE